MKKVTKLKDKEQAAQQQRKQKLQQAMESFKHVSFNAQEMLRATDTARHPLSGP